MNKKSKHEEIKMHIISKINRGEYAEDDLIESENDLAAKFSVSRMTARKVVDELVVLGVLVRYRGKGTFVSKRPQFKDLQSFLCFTEEAHRKGLTVTNTVVECRKEIANPVVVHHLGCDASKLVWIVRRIRNINNEPYAYEDSVYLATVFPDCNEEILKGSIYHHLEKDLGCVITFVTQQIIAVVADAKLAGFLNVEVGFPILKIAMTSYLKNGTAFELSSTYYRSDRFSVTQSAYRTASN
jgi:GntR family transcriptional regulator